MEHFYGAIVAGMALDTKPVSQLTEADIQDLIDNGVEEGREIDYKERLQIATDSEKKEFLADVSSFANASGGHLIIGVEEANGRPTAIKPLSIQNVDAEKLRVENLVRDGLAPRAGVELAAIPVSPSGHVLILRIPRSWTGPHMVTLQHNGRFYSRNSAGKYQLDVGELRLAFTAGASVSAAIQTFREHRLASIISGETPATMPDTAKLVIHCVPFESTSSGSTIDLTLAANQVNLVRPVYGGSMHRYNLDGIFSFNPDQQGIVRSYFQLFRDGKIECVDCVLFRDRETGKTIPCTAFAAACIGSVRRSLALLRTLGVSAPVAVMISLLGVKSYVLGTNPARGFDVVPIDRDIVAFAPEIVDATDVDVPTLLRPTFDALWNAAGLSRCGDYDSSGKPTRELEQSMRGAW